MGDETTLEKRILALESRIPRYIVNLELRITALEIALENLSAPRGQPDPDCAVDPTGEWY